MKFTKELVNEYADKLLIGLKEEENKMVLDEFDIIKANMEIIANIPDIEKVEPMTHALEDFSFSLREDEVKDELNINEIMQNCDNHNSREVIVPKVVN